MLTVNDAPSIVADHPELPVDRDNLSIDGTFVSSAAAEVSANGRSRIGIGDLLLAKDRKWESWHECTVIRIDGDLVTLVWSGLPESEVFTRRIWQLGTIHLQEMGRC